MQVAVIAGGLGTRLGVLTRDQPKSLIKILDKPFIEYQFDLLKNNGITDIVLCLGHYGSSIKDYCGDGSKWGIKINYSFETRLLDTAGALKLAAPFLEEFFFTLYGDSYLFVDFKEMLTALRESHKPAAMAVYRNNDLYDKSNTVVADGLVTGYSKASNNHFAYIDYGVNLFHKEVLDLIQADQPYSLGALFNSLIERRELLAHEVKQRFYEIGSIKGIHEFEEYISSNRL